MSVKGRNRVPSPPASSSAFTRPGILAMVRFLGRNLSLIDKDIPAAIIAREKASRDPWCKGQDPHLDPEAVIHEDRSQDPWGEPESFQQTFVGQLDPPIPQGKLGPIQEIPCQAEVDLSSEVGEPRMPGQVPIEQVIKKALALIKERQIRSVLPEQSSRFVAAVRPSLDGRIGQPRHPPFP